MMGERFPKRIRTHPQMTTLGGLEASPHFAKGLLDHAQAISTNPSEETIILLAHGTGSDEENAHWMNNLRTIADTMRAHGGDAFRDVKVHTWREDWLEKRKKTIPEIQKMVREASEDGTALVVPARTTAQGHASEYLDGLDYRYGKGFAPHPEFEAWMRDQIEAGIERLRAVPQAEAPPYAQGARLSRSAPQASDRSSPDIPVGLRGVISFDGEGKIRLKKRQVGGSSVPPVRGLPDWKAKNERETGRKRKRRIEKEAR